MIPLNNTCDVIRPVRTKDSSGGYTTAEVLIYESLPCRKSGASAADIVYAGAIQQAISAVLYSMPSNDIRKEDIILVDGERYTAYPSVSPSIQVYTKTLLKPERV